MLTTQVVEDKTFGLKVRATGFAAALLTSLLYQR